ncbi:MAG: ATP-binding protein [Ignavibacteriae bacterium]|nr:ATP-binding protein [Ignavibacteriota bacterium]
MNILNKINLQPKSFILIFIAVAILVITSALFEFHQSKKELYDLMAEQSHSLLETTLAASTNALLSYESIDSELKNRLLNNANLIKLLLDKNQINNEILKRIADQNKIYRINIFDKSGKKLFTNHNPIHTDLEPKFEPKEILSPIFNGLIDTLFLGVKQARFESGYRFAIAVAAKNRSAIVLNLDAEEILNFRKQIGFGSLLKKLTANKNLVYAVLQNSNDVLAASGNISNLENIEDSDFLNKSLIDSTFAWRTIDLDSLQIFEAVHPFAHNNRIVGLFRLGISLEPLNAINQRIIRRLIIIGIILFVLGSLLLVYIFTKQNFNLLQKKFNVMEGYSNKVIQNVSDGVIVLDENNYVKIINSAARKLFQIINPTLNSQKLSDLISPDEYHDLLNSSKGLKQIECTINNHKKYLLVSRSEFFTENNLPNTILVIRNLTQQKLLEDQIQRKERLIAMGELASGVAHEIRNPLNTISTITQQLNKDFEPIERNEEFHTLASLVNKEVKRINETINSFLRFAKPEKIVLKEFQLSDLIKQIEDQYMPMLIEKFIAFEKIIEWNGIVNWDRNQIQQVLMNLIQNSFDAIDNGGKIILKIFLETNEQIRIEIIDNGNGIPTHILNKVFNLYFTTKAKGTGIGLSLVQRIIFEHGGTISIESEENKGTSFIIILPQFPITNKSN